jgi:integrase
MVKPLTAAAVEKYRPGPQRRRIRDSGARSLFLVIEPSGHKSWQMRFRRPDGKPGKLTLGPVHNGNETAGTPVVGMPLTLAGARQLAADIHRQRALGADPVADHKARKHRQRTEREEQHAGAFAACVRTYVDEYAKQKLRNWREMAKLLGLDYPLNGDGKPVETKGGLLQRWADKQVNKVDNHDIWEVIDAARKVGVPGLEARNPDKSEARARGLFAALSSFFGWAQKQRLAHTNPVRGVPRPAGPTARERTLNADEIRWLWQACETVDAPIAPGAPKPFGPLLRLLLATGARRDEAAGLTHAELHGDAWHLPGSRTKNKKPHVVPLAPLARDLIASMPGHEGFVFTTNGRTPVSGWSRMKRRLDASMLALARKERGAKFTIPPWRLHDLRRTAVTGMAELGIRPDVIELTVNHVSGHRGGIAGVYNKSELLPEREAALERWARFIALMVDQELHAAHKEFLASGDETDRKEADKAFKTAVAEGGERWSQYLKMLAGEDNVFAFGKAKGRRRAKA